MGKVAVSEVNLDRRGGKLAAYHCNKTDCGDIGDCRIAKELWRQGSDGKTWCFVGI
jgi:hypothetical protein